MRNEVRKYIKKRTSLRWPDEVHRGDFFSDEDPVNQYKVFPHPEKIEKHSHNFDQNIRQRRSVTKYSHNSPDFCKPSAESARIYKCQAERDISVRPKERPKKQKKNTKNIERKIQI